MTTYGSGGYGGHGSGPNPDPGYPPAIPAPRPAQAHVSPPGPYAGTHAGTNPGAYAGTNPGVFAGTNPGTQVGGQFGAPAGAAAAAAGRGWDVGTVRGRRPVGSARRSATWPGVLALVLVVVLLLAVGFQTWQLYRLDSRLGEANDELAQQQAYHQERIEAMEGRASELERIAGEAFNPEAIADAVLPSVFRVRAGRAGGTAFAVGGEAADGGTNLFTNYHVVAELWNQGGREVSLERTNQRYPATIVDVDPEADVAWLQTSTQFTGLAVASEPARSGQQIVAVGAPFGLTDTVTVGVVSAADRDDIRDAPGRWIQFDAPINPGNSGGPVINAAQEVVGIATAGSPEAEGIGLARPIDVACDLFEVC